MRHLSEGLLRRLCDDRFAASNDQRDHLAHCARCQQRQASVATDATAAAQMLAADAGAAANVDVALGQLRRRAASGAGGGRAPRLAPRRVRSRRWAIGIVAAPVISVALIASASAAGWLSIFSPTQVAPVTLTAGELSGLPDLSGYGHMRVTQPSHHTVPDASHAAAATGLHVLQPASLPSNVPTTVSWETFGAGSATFTLDRAAADAAAASAGRAAPQIPAALDGAAVTVNAGPAVLAVYSTPTGAATGAGSATGDGGLGSTLPTLVIAESVRPTASTNGATLQQLEDFLLAQPGVSSQLGAEIRAIGQPASTLPIPVISGLMSSQTVSIDGVQGVAAGDSTGLGAAVVWEKDGVVYAVGGLLTQSEVLDIARSLR